VKRYSAGTSPGADFIKALSDNYLDDLQITKQLGEAGFVDV
jgi:hypothetical protein